MVIDVRNDSEWNEGHIPSAIHIPLGHLAERIAEVPADNAVVVQCQGGGRSSIAASLLQKMGRKNVANLTGGYQERWSRQQMKKILTGCLIVAVIAMIGFGVAGYYAYRFARPMIDNASDYLDKAREVSRLGDRVANKTPYVPPDERRADRGAGRALRRRADARPQRARRSAGPRSKRSRRRSATRPTGNSKDWTLSEFTSVFSDIANIYLDGRTRAGRRAQHPASSPTANTTGCGGASMKRPACSWPAASTCRRSKTWRATGAQNGVDSCRTMIMPEVPETNIKLVKPHAAQAEGMDPDGGARALALDSPVRRSVRRSDDPRIGV